MGGGSSKRTISFQGQNFIVGTTLGSGALGTVIELENEQTGELFACKQTLKANLTSVIKRDVMNEKEILSRVGCSTIVQLHCAIQDENYLYMVMTLLRGGELGYQIDKAIKAKTPLSLPIIRFWSGCLFHSLSYLHAHGIVHCDIKPENLIFDDLGYLFLTDFNISVFLQNKKAKGKAGTLRYFAPEMLTEPEYDEAVDIWGAGVLLFYIVYLEYPWDIPFTDEEEKWLTTDEGKMAMTRAQKLELPKNCEVTHKKLSRVFRKKAPYFPDFIGAGLNWKKGMEVAEEGARVPTELVDLMKGMLCPVEDRLTAVKVMKHPFFEGFDWMGLSQKTMAPPEELEPPPKKYSNQDPHMVGYLVHSEQQGHFQKWDWCRTKGNRSSFKLVSRVSRIPPCFSTPKTRTTKTHFPTPSVIGDGACERLNTNQKIPSAIKVDKDFIWVGFESGELEVYLPNGEILPVQFGTGNPPCAHALSISKIEVKADFVFTQTETALGMWNCVPVREHFKEREIRGKMTKLSPASHLTQIWQERLFIFDKITRLMSYYSGEEKNTKALKGSFLVTGQKRATGKVPICSSLEPDVGLSQFRILTHQRAYTLRPPAEEKENWVKAIQIALSPPVVAPVLSFSFMPSRLHVLSDPFSDAFLMLSVTETELLYWAVGEDEKKRGGDIKKGGEGDDPSKISSKLMNAEEKYVVKKHSQHKLSLPCPPQDEVLIQDHKSGECYFFALCEKELYLLLFDKGVLKQTLPKSMKLSKSTSTPSMNSLLGERKEKGKKRSISRSGTVLNFSQMKREKTKGKGKEKEKEKEKEKDKKKDKKGSDNEKGSGIKPSPSAPSMPKVNNIPSSPLFLTPSGSSDLDLGIEGTSSPLAPPPSLPRTSVSCPGVEVPSGLLVSTKEDIVCLSCTKFEEGRTPSFSLLGGTMSGGLVEWDISFLGEETEEACVMVGEKRVQCKEYEMKDTPHACVMDCKVPFSKWGVVKGKETNEVVVWDLEKKEVEKSFVVRSLMGEFKDIGLVGGKMEKSVMVLCSDQLVVLPYRQVPKFGVK